MRIVERAIRVTAAASMPEMAVAAATLTMLGLVGASPEFLLEIAVAIFCVDRLSRRAASAWAFRPALAQARSPHRKRGGVRK